MATAWRWYLRMLRDHTLPTQMVTGACIGFTADTTAQRVVERRIQQNWKRTGRQTLYSFFVFAPMANRWFAVLQRINFKNIWTTALARTGVDMVTFMPFSSFMFFTCLGTMEGRPFAESKHRWLTNFPQVIRNQYMVFAPAQIINMVMLPLYARPPFLNCVGLGWMLYLATVNSRPTVPMTPEGSAVTTPMSSKQSQSTTILVGD